MHWTDGTPLAWEPARIRQYLLAIAPPAVARLRAPGFGVALPPGLAPETVRAALAQRHIHVPVRVAPHVCNVEDDL